MFGRGRPKKVVKVEPIEEDEDDEEEVEEKEEELEEEVPVPTQKSKAKMIEQKKSIKCKIVEGTLLENGVIRYTIVADSSIGEIGDEFEFG